MNILEKRPNSQPSLSTKDVTVPLVAANILCDNGEPASAMVVVGRGSSEELAFCAHHYNKFEATLITQGWFVTADSRKTLTARETEVHA